MVDRWESPVSALPLGCRHSQRAPPWTLALSSIVTTGSLPQASLILGAAPVKKSSDVLRPHPNALLMDHPNPCPHECNVMLGPLGCRDTRDSPALAHPLPLLGEMLEPLSRWTRTGTSLLGHYWLSKPSLNNGSSNINTHSNPRSKRDRAGSCLLPLEGGYIIRELPCVLS